MKKRGLKGYLPILVMAACAAVLGALTLSGVLDLNRLPELVKNRPMLAAAVVLALFALKGLSGVIVYNVLVVAVSLIFPLPAALIINGAGLAVSLSVSFLVGHKTDPSDLNSLLNRYSRVKRYFTASQDLGFAFCLAIHTLGINMELLGVLFGMLRGSYWTYLISSWLAIYPKTVCFTILGNQMDLRSPVFWFLMLVHVGMMAYALLYCRWRMSAPGGEMPVDTGKSISSDNNDVS